MTTSLRGIRIVFDPEAPAFIDWAKPIEGFDSTVQCVMTHLGTSEGADAIFPTRGTALLNYGLIGRLSSTREAAHECNFAAVKVKDFVEDHTPPEITERISRVRVVPEEIVGRRLDTTVTIDTTSGLVVGSMLSV